MSKSNQETVKVSVNWIIDLILEELSKGDIKIDTVEDINAIVTKADTRFKNVFYNILGVKHYTTGGYDESYVLSKLETSRYIARAYFRIQDNLNLLFLWKIGSDLPIVQERIAKYVYGSDYPVEISKENLVKYVITPTEEETNKLLYHVWTFVNDELFGEEDQMDVKKIIAEQCNKVLDEIYQLEKSSSRGFSGTKKQFSSLISPFIRDVMDGYTQSINALNSAIKLIDKNRRYTKEPDNEDVKYLKEYFGISSMDTLSRNKARLARKFKMLDTIGDIVYRIIRSEIAINAHNAEYEKELKKNNTQDTRGRKTQSPRRSNKNNSSK